MGPGGEIHQSPPPRSGPACRAGRARWFVRFPKLALVRALLEADTLLLHWRNQRAQARCGRAGRRGPRDRVVECVRLGRGGEKLRRATSYPVEILAAEDWRRCSRRRRGLPRDGGAPLSASGPSGPGAAAIAQLTPGCRTGQDGAASQLLLD